MTNSTATVIGSFGRALRAEGRTIRRGGGIFLASMSGAILVFLANLFLSRFFGPTEFGRYKTVLTFAYLLPAIFELGIAATITRTVAAFRATGQDRAIPGLLRRLLGFRLLTYLPVLAFLIGFRGALADTLLHDGGLGLYFLPAAVLIVLGFLEYSRPILAGYQRFGFYTISAFVFAVATAVLSLGLGFSAGVPGAVLGLALAYPVANIPNLLALRRAGAFRTAEQPAQPPHTFELLRTYALPFYFASLPSFLTMAAVPILALRFPPELIGYFGFALTFYVPTVSLASAIGQVLFPQIAGFAAAGNETDARAKLRRILTVYTPACLAGIALTLTLSEAVVAWLAPSFSPAVPILKGLVITGLLQGFLTFLGTYWSGRAKLRKVGLVNLVSNLGFFGVSFWLVRLVGG